MPRTSFFAAAAIVSGLLGLSNAPAANAATTPAQANAAWNTMTCADYTKMDKAHQADVINQISAANTQPATNTAAAGQTGNNATAKTAATTASPPATSQAPGANLTADKLTAACNASPNATLGSIVPAGQVTSAGGAGASSTTTNNQ